MGSNTDGKDLQELSGLLSHIEGFLKLKHVPVDKNSIFVCRLRVERIFDALKKIISGEVR